MAYLLDANVFIQAKNLHYGMDFCPAFWDWLIQQNSANPQDISTKDSRQLWWLIQLSYRRRSPRCWKSISRNPLGHSRRRWYSVS